MGKQQIKTRFNDEKEQQPALSSWMAFVRAIKGQDYSRSAIRRNFYNLVDKSDYIRSGMADKIGWLMDKTRP